LLFELIEGINFSLELYTFSSLSYVNVMLLSLSLLLLVEELFGFTDTLVELLFITPNSNYLSNSFKSSFTFYRLL